MFLLTYVLHGRCSIQILTSFILGYVLITCPIFYLCSFSRLFISTMSITMVHPPLSCPSLWVQFNLHKNQCRMDLPLLICPNTCGKLGTFSAGSSSFFFILLFLFYLNNTSIINFLFIIFIIISFIINDPKTNTIS